MIDFIAESKSNAICEFILMFAQFARLFETEI